MTSKCSHQRSQSIHLHASSRGHYRPFVVGSPPLSSGSSENSEALRRIVRGDPMDLVWQEIKRFQYTSYRHNLYSRRGWWTQRTKEVAVPRTDLLPRSALQSALGRLLKQMTALAEASTELITDVHIFFYVYCYKARYF